MSILFLISGLGVINGGLVGCYLLFRKQRTLPEIYFAGLLLAFSIRIGKSVYFYFSEDINLNILQIGLSVCVFIGPFFYLYVRTLSRRENAVKSSDIIFLAALLLVITVLGIIFPYSVYPEIWTGYIIYGIYLIWIIFTIAGVIQSARMFRDVGLSFNKMNGEQQYFFILILAVVCITVAYQLALFARISYITAAIIFSFSFYFLVGRALFTNKPVIPKTPIEPLENGAELLASVKRYMDSEKPYLNRNLKLNDLAEQVGISRNSLSRVLNEEFEGGFSNFIKQYRVEEAKKIISSGTELSLEGVGYEAGFRSKSAFFDSFKKATNSTPAEFQSNKG